MPTLRILSFIGCNIEKEMVEKIKKLFHPKGYVSIWIFLLIFYYLLNTIGIDRTLHFRIIAWKNKITFVNSYFNKLIRKLLQPKTKYSKLLISTKITTFLVIIAWKLSSFPGLRPCSPTDLAFIFKKRQSLNSDLSTNQK